VTDYDVFLLSKVPQSHAAGFSPSQLNSQLFPFQQDIVRWAVKQGRAALFEDCGLGKTAQQLEWAHQVYEHTGKKVIIVCPLAVADQTVREAGKFGVSNVKHCRQQSEVVDGITVTNYERLHCFDLSQFVGVVLDESSILKAYDGKTRTQIIDSFKCTPYRLACTATPAPNDFMELGNHAEFLGVMTRSEMLATFFVHDGGDTSKWRLKGHAEKDFWCWICSWAVNIRKPSDLGYSDDGFALPELNIAHKVVESGCALDGFLFALPASSLQERRIARRGSLKARVDRTVELANSNDEQWLIWCDLNDESTSCAKAINGAVEVTGSDSDEHKADAMLGFSEGRYRVLVTKGDICGFGMNWQQSWNQIFCGLSDSYERFYQCVRRQYRFGQKSAVNAYVITSNLEGAVVANIQRKQADSDRMAAEMVKHMASLSAQVINGATVYTGKYTPTIELQIPSWL
jgi:hypothetical protein